MVQGQDNQREKGASPRLCVGQGVWVWGCVQSKAWKMMWIQRISARLSVFLEQKPNPALVGSNPPAACKRGTKRTSSKIIQQRLVDSLSGPTEWVEGYLLLESKDHPFLPQFSAQ